ncbi:hypothetical protein F9047_11235 [Escherichia coli]|nr:hypothetical protein F9047_11235 [Escherichia coli]
MQEMLIVASKPGAEATYVGILSEGSFISHADLVADLAPANILAKAASFKYFIYTKGGKTIIVPSHPIGRDNYQAVYLKGAVFGSDGVGITPPGVAATAQDRKITIGQDTYRVRLMSGVPNDVYGASATINVPDFTPVQEYDLFVPNMWALSDQVKAVINFHDLFVPESVKVTKPNYTGSTRSGAMVKGNLTTKAFIRGRFDTNYPDSATYPFKYVQFDNTYLQTTVNNGIWWPVFEKL